MDERTKKSLEEIRGACHTCKRADRKPRILKVTVGADGLPINDSAEIEKTYIYGRPDISRVHEATHLSAAYFLRNQSSETIWKTIQRILLLVYIGPPDQALSDRGSIYVLTEVRDILTTTSVKLRQSPIENCVNIGMDERYYAPF